MKAMLPRLLMPNSFCLPPVEYCRGTTPTQAITLIDPVDGILKAGIREGDVIEAIDDQPASKFTLDQVRQMFKEAEGKEHSLTIRRNHETHTPKLRLRRIILNGG